MNPRLKAVDGLIRDLGRMEYEDAEKRRAGPASRVAGEQAAPTSERTATSLPTGGNSPADKPPEYKTNVDDVAEQTYGGGSGPRERFDTPAEAQGVPSNEAPRSDTGMKQPSTAPVVTSPGRGKNNLPPVTEAHETQHGKMPIVHDEGPVVDEPLRKDRRRSLKF